MLNINLKVVATIFLIIYIFNKTRTSLKWVEEERRKYRDKPRVTNTSLNRQSTLFGIIKTYDEEENQHTCRKNKYQVLTYSPDNIYKGHVDHGVYYFALVAGEFLFVIAILAYIFFY